MVKKNVQQLRAEVMRKQRNAQSKMSRIARERGVHVRGTEYDVVRDSARVRRYNAAQLRAYERQLDEFNRRQTQFHAGASGTIITGRTMNRLKIAERDFNRRAQQQFEKIADIRLPGSNMTIRQRQAMLNDVPEFFDNRVGAEPFAQRRFNARNINGEAAAEKLIASMKRASRADYLGSRMDRVRSGVESWIENMGMPDSFKNEVMQLSDEQLHVWYFYTDADAQMGMRYDQVNAFGSRAGEIAEQAEVDLIESLEWAKSINV